MPVMAEQGLTALSEELQPSIVLIESRQENSDMPKYGTGFFVNKDGTVITNYHVIEGMDKITVIAWNGQSYPVYGVLPSSEDYNKDINPDLACLSINVPRIDVTPLSINISVPEVGNDIFVVGYPLGDNSGLKPQLTAGKVSKVHESEFYVDTSLLEGSSGSPVFGMNGEVLGVATLHTIGGSDLFVVIPSKSIIQFLIHLEGTKSSSDEIYQQGGYYFDKGDYERALYYYGELISKEPDNAGGYYLAGLCNDELGNYSQSAKYYRKVTEIDPSNVDAWNLRGISLERLSLYNESLESYNKAIQLNASFAPAWNNKANVLSRMGRHVEALHVYNETIKLDPENETAWYNKGKALSDLGRTEEAIQAFNKSIKLDPDYASPWNGIGDALADLGKFNESLVYFDRAIEVDPLFSLAWNNKGLILHRLNRYKESLECFDEATRID